MSSVTSGLLRRLAARDPRRTLRVLARLELAGVFSEAENKLGHVDLEIATPDGCSRFITERAHIPSSDVPKPRNTGGHALSGAC